MTHALLSTLEMLVKTNTKNVIRKKKIRAERKRVSELAEKDDEVRKKK